MPKSWFSLWAWMIFSSVPGCRQQSRPEVDLLLDAFCVNICVMHVCGPLVAWERSEDFNKFVGFPKISLQCCVTNFNTSKNPASVGGLIWRKYTQHKIWNGSMHLTLDKSVSLQLIYKKLLLKNITVSFVILQLIWFDSNHKICLF